MKIKIFENKEFGSMRTLEEGNKVFFCGKDAATALGYRDTVNALKTHCKEDGVVIHHLIDSMGRKQAAKFISEGNLYRLISHSRLPSAEKFESWIFDNVLPTIRKTGGYVADEDMFVENYLPFLDEPYRNLFRLQMMAINQLNERIRHDQPLVEFANQVSNTENLIDMNAMAKLAVQKNIPIGRNRLFRWLRENGILMSGNLPYQKFIDRGYFAVKESVFETDSFSKTYQQTFVTGKGQRFIVGLLKKYYNE
ncbi:MAG: phage antirepressor KilAC domain-containing protein [Ruminococcus flavefaciens]|nr:phage antirepressor KilAC domain-containing protein [Ruminococcus flavefaciens]